MNKIQKISILFLRYLLLPGSILLQLYFILPAPIRFSWRWSGIFGALAVLVELLLWLQTRYFVIPGWNQCGLRKKIAWAWVAGLFTLFLFVFVAPDMTQVMEKVPFLAPNETLELHPILTAPDSRVDIWKIKIGDVRVPNSAFHLRGNWNEEENLLWTRDPQASLVVSGKVARDFSISFWRSPNAGQVKVQWDGKSKTVNLQGERKEEALYHFVFDPASRKEPDISRLIRFLTLPAWACLAFLSAGVFYIEI